LLTLARKVDQDQARRKFRTSGWNVRAGDAAARDDFFRETTMKIVSMFLCIGFLLLLGGCATITKGTQQTVTISTDPAGAICNLTREGKPLAVVNPTPGSVPIEKAVRDITIACSKAGYKDAGGTMASEFQAWTFGNIILGGIIGVVVDAASGAMNQYPSMVTFTLEPEAFASAQDRDAFFDRMTADLKREVAEVKERTEKQCRDNCATQLTTIDQGEKAKLAEIAVKRAQAVVR
jgi:hypothetical protein